MRRDFVPTEAEELGGAPIEAEVLRTCARTMTWEIEA
jgi:hypothetical protein